MGDSFKFYNLRRSNFVRGMKTRKKERKRKWREKREKRKWRVIRVELRTIKVCIDSNSRVEIPRFGDFTKLYVTNKKSFWRKENSMKRERNEIWKNEKAWKAAKKSTRKMFAVFIFKWGTPEDEKERGKGKRKKKKERVKRKRRYVTKFMSDSTNMFFWFFFFQSSLRLQPTLFTLLFPLSHPFSSYRSRETKERGGRRIKLNQNRVRDGIKEEKRWRREGMNSRIGNEGEGNECWSGGDFWNERERESYCFCSSTSFFSLSLERESSLH